MGLDDHRTFEYKRQKGFSTTQQYKSLLSLVLLQLSTEYMVGLVVII